MRKINSNNFRKILLNDTPLMDVRAPVEFTKGSIPGAVNLPLMDDEQRKLVGIRYKEAGQDAAIILGRELVTPEIQEQRVKQWKQFIEGNSEGLLYCFRGGLRSKITQQWINEAGINYPYVEGGYKAMRQYLMGELASQSDATPLIIINGRTGTGKTLLLKRIGRIIDLEGLANHRGSSFGNLIQAQPSVIDFENRLSVSLMKLNSIQLVPVFVEGEGRMIGRVNIPEPFWNRMTLSPHVVLESPLEKRVTIAIEDYIIDLFSGFLKILPREQALIKLSERHSESLFRIRKRLGGVRYEQAKSLLDTALTSHRNDNSLDEFIPFIELLLTQYYDPMYDYQLSRRSSKPLFRGTSDEILQWSEHYLEHYQCAS